MTQFIHAIYRDGVFVPDEPVSMAAESRVTLKVEAASDEAASAVEPSEDEASSRKRSDAIDAFLKYCEEHPIYSGLKLTRDELHDRD